MEKGFYFFQYELSMSSVYTYININCGLVYLNGLCVYPLRKYNSRIQRGAVEPPCAAALRSLTDALLPTGVYVYFLR